MLMKTLCLVAAAWSLTACGETQPDLAATPRAASPSAAMREAVGQAEDLRIGQSYRFDLRTHCGIELASFDGRAWRLEGGPPAASKGNPPSGWDENQEPGVLTLETERSAVFDPDAHEPIRYVATDEPIETCDN